LLILFFAGCDYIGGWFNSSDPNKHPVVISEDIIDTVLGLDEMIAYMSNHFVTSAKINIKDIQVWEDLDRHYSRNPEKLVDYGISGMEISYIERKLHGYLEAEVTPKYEMFMKIIIAVENDNVSSLDDDETIVYNRARSILKEVDALSGSKFNRAFAIHEYLAETIEYDHDYRENDNAFNIYGALIDGLAVCQGYAHAYKLLLHMAGVQNIIITGFAGNENHAWNLVNYGTRSNPDWYHVDVTWNAGGGGNNNEESRTRRYFNIDDEMLLYTHQWNQDMYPSANSQKFNYFKYNGFMVTTQAELEAAFTGHYNEKSDFFEILCMFKVTPSNLDFLREYNFIGEISFSTVDYGGGTLLKIIL